MDFDEYEYLENAVENPEPRKSKDKASGDDGTDEFREENGVRRSNNRSHEEQDDRSSKRSRSGKDGHDQEKDRKSRHGGSSRDREKDRHKSSRDDRSRHKEDGNGREKDRERERARESRDREKERERDGDKKRDISNKERREREHGKEREGEGEVERSRHSKSRSERVQSERGRESSRDKEKSTEKDFMERQREFKERDHDSRRKRDKKDDAVDPPPDPERDQRTVFAYQITMKADERAIYEFFSRAGKVRDVRLITDRNTGRSRGVGYIEFYDVMSVPMAIALSGQPLLGQPMMVKPSEAEKNLVQSTAAGSGGGLGPYSGGARRLYVGNLPLTIKEEQIRQVFEPFGIVELVQMPTDLVTGNCKGYAFIQYARLEDAKLAQNLNGQLEIGGQVIKVSAVTDQAGMQDAGANMADLDDDDGTGLSLNAHSRALLMQKLDRTGAASSINGTFENSIGQTSVPAVYTPIDTIGVPSACLLLKNMFDPTTEAEPDFDLDIKEDVSDECSKFGTLKHIYVEKNSAGFVYLRFENTEAAIGAQRALHGRWFAGKMITATFMMELEENTNSTTQVDTSTERSGTEPGELPMNLQKTFYIYREDVVIHKTNGKIGTVTEVAEDSDSDSSNSGDENDCDEDEFEKDDEANFSEEGRNDENTLENADDNNDLEDSADNDFDHLSLKPDHIRVIWIDDSETTEHSNDVTVVDRGFVHGDYVASASDPAGQIGIVVDANIKVNLLGPDGSVSDIPSKDLKRIRDFTVGDHVVLGAWLGRIEYVFDDVTVSFDDGSVCKVMKADPLQLKPVGGKKILEDGHFPYYPGQRVKAISSSVLKNAKWLSGFWKANRLEGTVSKVTVGSVYVYWTPMAGYGPDAAITPSEEQSPNNLKLLSCFNHTTWQLGDWCIFPSFESVSLDKGLLKKQSHNSTKDDHESTETGDESNQEASTAHAADAKLIENSSVSGLKESSHDAKPFRKKIRKLVVRKDNKKVRKKIDNFERAVLIINTKTKVDVAWQDGTIKRGLDSTSLISIETPGDHDFLSEQYVVERVADENKDDVSISHVGVVKSVNTKDRTACVRWLKPIARAEDPREFEKKEVASVYELERHPDYDYCYGDVVVRLYPVSLPGNMDSLPSSVEVGTHNSLDECLNDKVMLEGKKDVETALGDERCTEFTDLAWVGNITGLKEGDIEVTWVDGMVSTVGPHAICVVGRDDDYSMMQAMMPLAGKLLRTTMKLLIMVLRNTQHIMLVTTSLRLKMVMWLLRILKEVALSQLQLVL